MRNVANLIWYQQMEKYLVIDYQLLSNSEGIFFLDSLSTILVNPANPESSQPNHYLQLQDRQHFEAMLLSLIQAIFAESLKFTNICLVAPSATFFTDILESQCYKRGLTMPFIFRNYLDLQEIFGRWYNRRVETLEEMMNFYQQVHIIEPLKMMRRILLRMCQDGAIKDKDRLSLPNTSSKKVNEERYFKVVGWPFNIKGAEIRERLVESKNQDKVTVFFINQNGKFSGNVYVSVLANMADEVRQKNKARVGTRYIQVKEVDEFQFDTAKLKYNLTLQNIRKDFGMAPTPQVTFRKIEQPAIKYQSEYRTERSPLYRRNTQINRLKENRKLNRHHFRRQSSNSSSGSYGRNRRYSNSRSRSPENNSYFNSRYYPPHIGYQSCGIRIRGLPFSFECGDVLRLVDRFDPILDHIKMGHRFNKKSGEAAVLFDSYRQAYDALSLDGLTILGRYLEVILISEEDYLRFK